MSIETYKIRPLKWRWEPYGWVADTPWGRYLIELASWSGALGLWYVTFRAGEIDNSYHTTVDSAAVECQADFDRRVKGCLE